MKIVMCGLLVVAVNARAECFDEAARAKADALIAKATSIVEFCEPCGDKVPGEPMKALVRDRSRADIDYGSLYVATSTHRYENVAALVGCERAGVSPTLRVDDATATGVLIVPDSTPVAPLYEVDADDPGRAYEPMPEPAAAVVPIPTVTVIDHQSPIPMWPYAVIAGGAGTLAAIGVLGLAARTRRRRALQPRAVKLVARE